MAKSKNNEIIVGLDIGTTKIACVAGEVTEDGVDIIGVGTAPSRGMRRGMVANIDATVMAIQQAVDEAENMAGCEISQVYAAISGPTVRGLNKNGIVAVSKDKEIREFDMARVIEAARAVALPGDHEVVHVLPQQYVVDDQDGIRDPLGMSGVRLEARVHIVTAPATVTQNVIKCANRCNLVVSEIVLESLAASHAVLDDDEKELGVALLDIGGGTCDILVYEGGAIVHTAVLPLGGGYVTSDVACGLRTSLDAAEKIKRKYGCAWLGAIDDGEKIEVPSTGGRGPKCETRRKLVEIIEPRVSEIFEKVHENLVKHGCHDALGAGVVLTGGAIAMDGMVEVGEQVLGVPTRRGTPARIGGLAELARSPGLSTGVGLVLYGAQQASVRPVVREERGVFRRAWSRLAEMF
jgi:cell division protein FtsA